MSRSTGNSRLRIGYLMQNGAPDLSKVTGPQIHTSAVIDGLRKRGHHVRTVANQDFHLGWSDDLQTWFEPQFDFSQAWAFRLFESGLRRMQSELQLPYTGLFDSIRYADACVHLLRDYDILYERHGYMGYGGVIAARRLGIPLIIELNGNILTEIDVVGVKMSATQRAIGHWLTWRTFRAANQVVAVSDQLKSLLVSRGGVPEDRVAVVVNGVHLESFLKKFNAERVRQQYDLKPGPSVMHVGSFDPWHGVELLVSAFDLLQADYPEIQLVLIGDGPGRDVVVERVAEMGLTDKVTMTGRLEQDRVAAVLSVADVVVAPYPFQHSEIVGTPLKLLDYMAAGKAIVASTAPIHEIIVNDETGIRVSPADSVALAQGVSRLLDDEELRMRLGENSRCQAVQHHSWDKVVERTEMIMRGQLSG